MISSCTDEDAHENWEEIQPGEDTAEHSRGHWQYEKFSQVAEESICPGHPLFLWRIGSSVLEMMHLYAALITFACKRITDGLEHSYLRLLEKAARDTPPESSYKSSKRTSYRWITLCDAIASELDDDSGSILAGWVKTTLRTLHTQTKSQSQSGQKPVQTTDHKSYQTNLTLDFCLACIAKFVPVRLCFSLGIHGEILRECSWEYHQLHIPHQNLADEKHSCPYALWCEVYCLQKQRWIPVLPTMYENEDLQHRSVHYTWGSSCTVAIGSRKQLSYYNSDEWTPPVHSTSFNHDEFFQLGSGHLHLYSEEVTIKYTSAYVETMRQRKWPDMALGGDVTDDSDNELSESARGCIVPNERFIHRIGGKYGNVSSVVEIFGALRFDPSIPDTLTKTAVSAPIVELLFQATNPKDRYAGESRERSYIHHIRKRICPMPTSLQGFKSHPLYVVQAQLAPNEAVRMCLPGDSWMTFLSETDTSSFDWSSIDKMKSGAIAGFFKGSVVFHRIAVYTLRTAQEWLARWHLVPRSMEPPIRRLHSKKCKLSISQKNALDAQPASKRKIRWDLCECPTLYGRWQLEPYSVESLVGKSRG
ncbi:Rad4 beta-hairpin domain containing protein, partial [Perkinsela sp. CCAP 1560/4]